MINLVKPKKITFRLIYVGLDYKNRPVFKVFGEEIYFGAMRLFDPETPPDEVIEFYRNAPHLLEYFGTSFNCKPYGGKEPNWRFEI